MRKGTEGRRWCDAPGDITAAPPPSEGKSCRWMDTHLAMKLVKIPPANSCHKKLKING